MDAIWKMDAKSNVKKNVNENAKANVVMRMKKCIKENKALKLSLLALVALLGAMYFAVGFVPAKSINTEVAWASPNGQNEYSEQSKFANKNQQKISINTTAQNNTTTQNKLSDTHSGDICLNDEWQDTTTPYKIETGGTYYLSGDFSVGAALEIAASNQDVVINLESYTLTCTLNSTAIKVTDAKSVRIVGVQNAAQTSNNSSNSNGNIRVLMKSTTPAPSILVSKCEAFELSNCNVTAGMNQFSRSISKNSYCALQVDTGTSKITDSNITLDLSMAEASTSYNASSNTGPTGVTFGASVTGGSITNSNITCKNAITVSSSSGATVAMQPEKPGSARAFNCKASGNVTLSGCNLSAYSPLGTAIGIYGKNVSVEGGASSASSSATGGVEISTYASIYEIGAYSTQEGGITIDGSMNVEYGREVADAKVGLCSDVGEPSGANSTSNTSTSTSSGAFVFGENFTTSGLSVWSGSSTSAGANTQGSVVGTFASSVSATAKERIVNALSNALYKSDEVAACIVVQSGNYVMFELKNAQAEVTFEDGQIARCSNVPEAISAAATGACTIKLLCDYDADINLGTLGSAGEAYTLDINGHSVRSVTYSGAANVAVTSSTETGKITGQSSANNAAISYVGSSGGTDGTPFGVMSVTNIDINVNTQNNQALGILMQNPGSLELDNVNVNILSSESSAVGIRVDKESKTNTDRHVNITNSNVKVHANWTGSSATAFVMNCAYVATNIENSTVEASAYEASVRGIEYRDTLTLENSNVSVNVLGNAGEDISTEALYAICPTSSTSSSDASEVRVPNAQIESSNITATCEAGASSGTNGESTGESGTAQGTQDSQNAQESTSSAWCFTSSEPATTAIAPKITLSGACSLISNTNTHINEYGNSLTFASSFSLTSESDQPKIYVCANSASNHVFASAQSEQVATSVISTLQPVYNTYYDGWRVKLNETETDPSINLQFSREENVVNTTQNTTHLTLNEALEVAKSGDTLQLRGDEYIAGALTLDKNLTIDMNGNALNVHAGGEAATTNSEEAVAGIIYSGSGNFNIVDTSTSATKAKINIYVGNVAERTSQFYSGIAVANAGTCSVSNVDINVQYSTTVLSTSTTKDVEVRGIFAAGAGSSLNMQESAGINVTSANINEGLNSCNMVGIYASAGAGTIQQSSNSNILVNNNTSLGKSGVWKYGDYSSGSKTHLLQIHPENQTDKTLYNEIVQAFRTNATYDSEKAIENSGNSSSLSTKTYASNIYYALGMQLEGGAYDGLNVWAYSNPVDPEHSGDPEYMVPSYIYVCVQTDITPDAYGISAQDGFAGNVKINGSVNAQTGAGHAYGVYKTSTGTWVADTQNITSSCTSDTFVYSKDTTDNDRLDISNVIHESQSSVKANQEWYYEKQTTAPFIAQIRKSVAEKIASQDVSYDVIDTAAPDADPTYQYALAPADGKINVTFTNLRDANGNVINDVTTTVDYGSTIGSAGGNTPYQEGFYYIEGDANNGTNNGANNGAQDNTEGDAETNTKSSTETTTESTTEGGTRYYFVGWQASTLSTNSQLTYLYSSEGLQSQASINGYFKEACKGNVTFTAVYVPVQEGESFIQFMSEYYTVGCAVGAGEQPKFSSCAHSSSVYPEYPMETEGYSYIFKGWTCGDVLYDLPKVPQNGYADNAKYYATYDKELAKTAINLYTYTYTDSQDFIYYGKTFSEVDWTQGSEPLINQMENAHVGDTITNGTAIYTLLGWSTRPTDTVPIWTDNNPPITYTSDDFGNDGSATLFAIYSKSEQSISYECYVDGNLEAEGSASPSESIRVVFGTDPKLEGYTFRGWTTNENNTIIKSGEDPQLQGYMTLEAAATAAGGGNSVKLYAQFTRIECIVVFYDSDKATVFDTLAVPYGETVWGANQQYANRPTGEALLRFLGWVDSDGNEFDEDKTPVTKSMNVFANYSKKSDGGSGKMDGDTTTDDSNNQIDGGASTSDTSGTGSSTSSTSGSSAGSGSLSSASLSSASLSSSDAGLQDASVSLQDASAQSAGGSDGASANANAQGDEADASAQAGAVSDMEDATSDGNEVNNTAGYVACGVLALLVILGIVALVRWFIHRHAGEREEEEQEKLEENTLLVPESIRF